MEAYIFNTDNTSETIEPENGKDGFTLEKLQSIVGGSIELVPIKHCKVCGMEGTMVMVVNEDGLLKKLPKNYMASAVASIDLVGDALYCPKDWIK